MFSRRYLYFTYFVFQIICLHPKFQTSAIDSSSSFTCFLLVVIPLIMWQLWEASVVEKEVNGSDDSNESRQDVEMVGGGNRQEVDGTCQDAVKVSSQNL